MLQRTMLLGSFPSRQYWLCCLIREANRTDSRILNAAKHLAPFCLTVWSLHATHISELHQTRLFIGAFGKFYRQQLIFVMSTRLGLRSTFFKKCSDHRLYFEAGMMLQGSQASKSIACILLCRHVPCLV